MSQLNFSTQLIQRHYEQSVIDYYDDGLIIDCFAGGGGASTGIEKWLGQPIDYAINHSKAAIDMHKLNHPDTIHFCENIWDVNPRAVCQGRPVKLLWGSPDCTHFSIARAGVPVKKNIRGLAWSLIRWACMADIGTLILENVKEFLDWAPVIHTAKGLMPDPDRKGEFFTAFIECLTTGLSEFTAFDIIDEIQATLGEDFCLSTLEKGLGYNVEYKVLKACDFGTPTIRKRLYLIAKKHNQPIVWPQVTHGNDENLLPFETTANYIDWSIPVRSIFNRKKPLVENTLKRIARGLEQFVFCDNPFIVPEQCTVPFITEHANGSSQRNMPLDSPLRTICAQVKGGHFALVNPVLMPVDDDVLITSHIMKMRGDNTGCRTDEPIHTISASGLHHSEVRAFLVQYYGNGNAHRCDKPLNTITTKDRFGLVTVKGKDYQIIDIGMRMLEPHELFLMSGFPADYKHSFDSLGKRLTKAEQVNRVGNAVCPTMAEALVRVNVARKQTRIAA